MALATARPTWNQVKGLRLFAALMLQLQGSQATINTESNTFIEGDKGYGNGNNSSCATYLREQLKSLCKEGLLKEAFHILHVMDQRRICTDCSVYACLLQRCVDVKAQLEGKLVHAHMINAGFNPDIYLGTKLVIMYAKCGSLRDARRALDEMPMQNVVSWTAMIAACARHGCDEEALTLFYQMQRMGIQPNQFTFACVLPVCANLAALAEGKEVHEGIIRSGFQSDVFVGSALIDMYCKCESLKNARKVFDKMRARNVVSWNAMISGYTQNGHVDEALKLFQKMPERNVVSWTAIITAQARDGQDEAAFTLFYQLQHVGIQPDQFTFASVLPACANLAALQHGKQVHECIIRTGFQSADIVGGALVDMYIKCKSVQDAHKVFDKIPERNVLLWNAMIAGHAQNGHVDEAVKLFQKMPERDIVSWNAMIAGYSQNRHVDEALKVFHKMPQRNVVSWNAIIAAYIQDGRVNEALKIFQKLPEQDVISWNGMIAGHAKNGFFNEALNLFHQMKLTYVKPNSVTFASALPACANTAALEHGKDLHEEILRNGFQSDIFVGNALLDVCQMWQNRRCAQSVSQNS